MNYWENKAAHLEDEVALAKSIAEEETVTVELSLHTAWLLRDMIGLCDLSTRCSRWTYVNNPPMREDMLRLNKALGFRPLTAEPSVPRWSQQAARRAMGLNESETV